MQGLLHWVLTSPWRSGILAAALALSRLFDVFGAGLIALVTLRKGFGQGLQAVLFALPLIVAGGYISGMGAALAIAIASLWLPVMLLCHVLRRTASLALMMQAGAILAGVILAGWYLLDPEPLAAVRAFLDQQVLPLVERMEGGAPQLDDAQRQALVRIAPGFMAAGSLLIATLAVMVGRWWQAIAFNPGGFQRDFHRLRQGRSAALITVSLVFAAALTGQPVLMGLALAGLVTLLFQGIALVHGVINATGQSVLWLWGLYGSLLLLPLPATVVLVIAGGVDNWMDFRRLAGHDAFDSNE